MKFGKIIKINSYLLLVLIFLYYWRQWRTYPQGHPRPYSCLYEIFWYLNPHYIFLNMRKTWVPDGCHVAVPVTRFGHLNVFWMVQILKRERGEWNRRENGEGLGEIWAVQNNFGRLRCGLSSTCTHTPTCSASKFFSLHMWKFITILFFHWLN